MDTTDNTRSPKRRIEDQAPARIPLRAVASMCVKPNDISFFPTAAGKLLEPGHYMLSVQGAAIACTDAGAVPAAGESKAQLQAAAPSAGTTANPDGSTSTIVTERERQLENYLAELRDMFQTPEDDELHALWMEAWTDPEYVAPYVKAQFAHQSAALEALRVGQQAVPEGFVLVPKVATAAMVDAAHRAESCGNGDSHFVNAYAAMLAAAPAPAALQEKAAPEGDQQ